jgi:hypothetical protein
VFMAGDEQAKALHDVVTGLPRVADVIAKLSTEEHRAWALEVAERNYERIMKGAGCNEQDARRWAATLTSRLRKQIPAKEVVRESRFLKALYDELTEPGG